MSTGRGVDPLALDTVADYEYVEIQKMVKEDIYDDICNVRSVQSKLQEQPVGGEKRRFIIEVNGRSCNYGMGWTGYVDRHYSSPVMPFSARSPSILTQLFFFFFFSSSFFLALFRVLSTSLPHLHDVDK